MLEQDIQKSSVHIEKTNKHHLQETYFTHVDGHVLHERSLRSVDYLFK